MKKKTRKVMSLVLAVLMVVSIMPVTMFNNTDVVKAATAETDKSVVSWSAADILAAANGDNGLTLCGDGWSNNNAIDEKTFEDGFSALGDNAKAGSAKATDSDGNKASGTVPVAGCYVTYTAPANGTLSIDTKIGKGKTFYVVAADGTKAAEVKNTTDASTYNTVTAQVEAGKTYYAYLGGATAQIWKVYYTANEASWSAADILAAGEGSNGLTLCGDGWSNNNAIDEKTFEDGFSALGDNAKAGSAKATDSDGNKASGTVPVAGCYVTYTAPANGTLSIDTKIGKGKTFYVVAADGTKAAEVKNTTDASTYNTVTAQVEAGKTYYAYLGGATAQIWKVYYSPISEKAATPWSEVKAPVINSVEVVDGSFVVNFDAVIDEYEGAEDVQVTMFYNGFEVSTEVIKSQKDSAKFTPQWSGNYSFKVVAQRTGEADKASEEVKYDNYVLAVKKPVIELAQNKGNGTVYLDWMNITDADSYAVSYKLSDAAEYTVAEEANTKGNATITGLTVGKTYDFKIDAKRNSDSYVASYVKENFEVVQDDTNDWFFATVGSAQMTKATVKDAAGEVIQTVDMSSKDDAAEKVGLTSAKDVTGSNGSVTFKATDNGKISDGEEGFQYYYTMINPNTENFELTATFKITDTSLTPDNQTGFGVIASDMLGYNYWGKPDYVHKLFNNISTQMYSVKAKFVGNRAITGYNSIDTSSYDDVTRTTKQQSFKNTSSNFTEGETYTFTLKKTNDAWISISNGEELKYDNLAALSVQEDGSIAVGVFSARKVGVEISDIKFTKSESTGVGENVSNDKTTPSVYVASTGTANSSEYEYIYTPNVAGTLEVFDNDGKSVNKVTLNADEVARVKVPVKEGENTITSEFTPDNSQSLTSYDVIKKSSKVEYKVLGDTKEMLYVSPDGKEGAAGTKEDPMDIYSVVKYAQPGQYITLLNGTYTGSDVKINYSVSGTADKHIKLVAEEANKVIFDGMGLNISGSYWDVYGIYVKKPSSVGIQICGNYNTIDMCTVEGSQNTGIQISRTGSANNVAGRQGLLWPSYNLVKNCESFDNCDPGRNDADGFAAKLTSGDGNVFYGCISHNNIDDGWDLFSKTISGEIGVVTIENCVAYNNGWLSYEGKDDPKLTGEGNGFKLGGSYMKGGHILKNCVSFNNLAKGITSNSCPDCQIYDCTSFGNAIGDGAVYNVGLNTKETNLKEWVVKGLISTTSTDYTTTADLIPFSYNSEDNFIFNGAESRNSEGKVVTNDWFKSVDVSVVPTRNEDGTIDMHGLLELTDAAPSNTGARLDVTSKKAISVKPSMPGKAEIADTVEKADTPTVNAKLELADVLTAEELEANNNGTDVKVTLDVNNADATVSDTDKKLVEDKVAEAVKDGVVGQYVDISINKTIGETTTEVTETNHPIAVSVTVPEKLINTDSTKTREYSIVRLHNGVAEVLEGAKTETVDGKLVISFSTDKFSTYVIVYKDTVKGNSGSDDSNKGDDNTPSTPDKPTEPVTPEKPSTGDVTGNTDAATDNGAASNTDSTTAAATESGESTVTGDMAHTAVYAVLAMMAAGLVLSVVVYDNKKKRI